MKTIKCYFLSCKETIEIDVDDAPQASGSASVLRPGATFGHADYARVPFLARDEHRLSGKPWTCAFHDAMVGATLGLTDHEERQRQALVTQVRIGRMTKDENGWYSQVPPKASPPHTICEDDGTLRTNGMAKWWTPEQMIEALQPEAGPPAGYTVYATDPPAGFTPPPPPKVSDDGDWGSDVAPGDGKIHIKENG
jgi:hypothetical protein